MEEFTPKNILVSYQCIEPIYLYLQNSRDIVKAIFEIERDFKETERGNVLGIILTNYFNQRGNSLKNKNFIWYILEKFLYTIKSIYRSYNLDDMTLYFDGFKYTMTEMLTYFTYALDIFNGILMNQVDFKIFMDNKYLVDTVSFMKYKLILKFVLYFYREFMIEEINFFITKGIIHSGCVFYRNINLGEKDAFYKLNLLNDSLNRVKFVVQ